MKVIRAIPLHRTYNNGRKFEIGFTYKDPMCCTVIQCTVHCVRKQNVVPVKVLRAVLVLCERQAAVDLGLAAAEGGVGVPQLSSLNDIEC